MQSLYLELPSVHLLLENRDLQRFPLPIRTFAARRAVEIYREHAKNQQSFSSQEVVAEARRLAVKMSASSLKKVINLTGVILHTGLGRAQLASRAASKVYEVAKNYSNLEIQTDGKRGDRQAHVRTLLQDLTGAEGALVVNNCAAAVFLTLQALCSGKEVLLSYGQMVEIGGSFRMPDIIRQSGCFLVGVGSTNKTYIKDYQKGLTEHSTAVLRCHPSNFKITGFHVEPQPEEIAELCKTHGLMFIDDVGNGCIIDPARFGLSGENSVVNSLRAGADVVLASGDKLLGGPQAGLILGRKELIEKIRNHPIGRAVRIDKLSLAALEETLRLYLESKEVEIPFWQAVSKPLDEVKAVATKLAKAYPYQEQVEIVESVTEVGSGSLPGTHIPTYCAVISREHPEKLATRLRAFDPAIYSRVQEGRVWLDPRTLEQNELAEVCNVLNTLE